MHTCWGIEEPIYERLLSQYGVRELVLAANIDINTCLGMFEISKHIIEGGNWISGRRFILWITPWHIKMLLRSIKGETQKMLSAYFLST